RQREDLCAMHRVPYCLMWPTSRKVLKGLNISRLTSVRKLYGSNTRRKTLLHHHAKLFIFQGCAGSRRLHFLCEVRDQENLCLPWCSRFCISSLFVLGRANNYSPLIDINLDVLSRDVGQ